MGFDIAELIGQFAGAGLVADAKRSAVMGPVADHLPVFVIKFRHDVIGVFARLGFGVADDHMHAQPIIQRAVVCLGDRVHRFQMMLIVSRPFSIWSSVAMVRASMMGCISPQRTAASMLMFVVSGAIPATKLSVSCPT